ncbi:MAG: YceI family protein [Alphaproteobacteria bacterium]|nr:YceI family protein [Alphaproteobacteria bacterium]
MRPSLFATVATVGIAFTASCALAFTAPTTALEGVASGVYEIDPSHTSIQFGISHLGFSQYQGRFNAAAGTLAFDAKAPEKSTLAVTIDIAGIDTNNAKLESELKGDQWFDAAKFPTATFTSSSIEKLTATTGKVTGNLTLHGVTKPVTLDVTFNGSGTNPFANVAALGFSAHGTLKRSDFGITQYIPMVGDDVSIAIESELHAKR